MLVCTGLYSTLENGMLYCECVTVYSRSCGWRESKRCCKQVGADAAACEGGGGR